MPTVDDTYISKRIHEIVSQYGSRDTEGQDGFIERDFDINGSDPLEMLEEIEELFKVDFIDELIEKKIINRTFLGVKIGSISVNHIDDFRISELIKRVEEKVSNNLP